METKAQARNAVKKREYLQTHIKCYKILFLWPLPDSNRFLQFCRVTSVAFITVLMLMQGIFFGAKIVSDIPSLDKVTKVIDYFVAISGSVFHSTYMYRHGSEYLQLVKYIDQNFMYESFYPTANKMTLGKYMKRANILGLMFCMGGILLSLHACYGELIKHAIVRSTSNSTQNIEVPLPIDALYPFDISTDSVRGAVIVGEVVAVHIATTIYIVLDSFWWMVLILVIGQNAIISHSLRNIENDLDAHLSLNDCIKQYQITRRFVKKVEDLLSPHMLVDCINGLIGIGLLLLSITFAINNLDGVLFAKKIAFLALVVLHFSVYDWLGNEIVVMEEEVSKALYDTPWYLQSKHFRYCVLMTMIHSRKPRKLTCGKTCTVTLHLFVVIVKWTYSYFMFFLHMRSKE